MDKKNELKRCVTMTIQREKNFVSKLFEIDHICYVFKWNPL